MNEITYEDVKKVADLFEAADPPKDIVWTKEEWLLRTGFTPEELEAKLNDE